MMLRLGKQFSEQCLERAPVQESGKVVMGGLVVKLL